MSEEEVTESSVESTDTSVGESSESQPEPVEAAPQDAEPKPEPEETPAPFHEHPRFKELIEQNRTYKEQAQKQSEQLMRLQYQFEANEKARQALTPKTPSEEEELLKQVESVNPQFAKYIKGLAEQAKQVTGLQEKLSNFEKYQQQTTQQQFANQAVSHFQNLLESNKISPEMRPRYEREVRAIVYEKEARGEKLGIKDLDGIFSSVHDEYGKFLESFRRQDRASYAAAKRSDTAPASTTGGAATSPGMKKFTSLDSPEAIAWVAQELKRANKKI